MKGLNKNMLFVGATLGVVALAIYLYNKNKGSQTSSNNAKSDSGNLISNKPLILKWKNDIIIPTYIKDSSGKLVEKGKISFKRGQENRFVGGRFAFNKDFIEAKLDNGDFIKIFIKDIDLAI
jgi:hypothetical protein